MEPSKQNPKPNGSLAQQQSLLASFKNQGVPEPELPEEESVTLRDEPWTEPEVFGGKLTPVQQMLPEMLPVALRTLVEDIMARMQVPLDFPAVVAVAILAGLVGRRACIQPKELDTSWREVPNLWGGIVAEPGSMKSPVLSAITAPAKAIERELLKEYEAAMQQHEQAAEENELAKVNWKEAARQSP